MSRPEDPVALNHVLTRNIEALRELARARERERTLKDKISDGITAFAGSVTFALLHAAILVFWLVANTGRLGIKPWDPYPFVMLAMAASVEAIFISTFVLIGQNHQAAVSDRRAELNLQIDLLAEHEITRLIQMVEAIATKLDATYDVPDLHEIAQDVRPETVVERIESDESA